MKKKISIEPTVTIKFQLTKNKSIEIDNLESICKEPTYTYKFWTRTWMVHGGKVEYRIFDNDSCIGLGATSSLKMFNEIVKKYGIEIISQPPLKE